MRPNAAAPVLVHGAVVTDHVVDRWVADLRRIVVGGQVEIIAQVGEYLLTNVYGGTDEAATRRRGKESSITKLAARAEEFGMTASGLTRAVPIALQVRALGKSLAGRLGVRQHRVLLPVKDPEEKKLLALAAVDEKWTAEDLQKRVRRIERPHPGGRSRAPVVRVIVSRASSVLVGVTPSSLREGIEQLTKSEAKKLLSRVNEMQATLERIEKVITKAAL
jgi:hypothetical protein